MRFGMLFPVLLLMTTCFLGCSVNIGSGPSDSWHTPDYDETASTMSEIDAAADLTFDDGKTRTFSNIASRPHLSARAQVYLVKQSMQSVTFDDNKRDILLALVNNPYFVSEGKRAVLDHLDALTFDSAKEQVLDAINARGRIRSERELHMRQQQQQQQEEAKPLTTEINGVEVQTYGEVRVEMQSSH